MCRQAATGAFSEAPVAARAGELVFDDDEYIYVRDPERVPAGPRPLFDAAWNDLDGEDDDERADPLATGLAMAEVVTGLEVSKEQVAAALEAEFFLSRRRCVTRTPKPPTPYLSHLPECSSARRCASSTPTTTSSTPRTVRTR